MVSGEFFLRCRPNGGGVVLARSLYVTLFIYGIALALKSYTTTGATFGFSLPELFHQINSTIPWAGAIFAGVYVAFYTRYSNQWSYLASTYNQITAAKAPLAGHFSCNNRILVVWQAGFITDAFTLHLDRKEIFKGIIASLLKDDVIKEEVFDNFSDKELEEFKNRHSLGESNQRTQTRCAGFHRRLRALLLPMRFSAPKTTPRSSAPAGRA